MKVYKNGIAVTDEMSSVQAAKLWLVRTLGIRQAVQAIVRTAVTETGYVITVVSNGDNYEIK